MAAKHVEMQGIIRLYKQQTGQSEVDMREVALYASSIGWPLPKPVDPIDRLATQFTKAARVETRKDEKTGRAYRVNHAISTDQGDRQLYLWIDIDHAPRAPMLKSLVNRREQMVGDGLQLTLDADHWNSIHPDEQPIVLPMDFTDDVEWRKNAPS